MSVLGDAINLDKKIYITIQDELEYKIAGVQSYGKGVVIRRTVKGSELTMKKYQVIKSNQLMWCKVDTKNGAFGITHEEHVGALASTNMALAEIDEERYLPQFIETLFQLKPFYDWITKYSSGSTNRKYLTPKELMIKVEIPDLSHKEQVNFQNRINFFRSCGLFSELTHQQTLLKKLRQQILQEAIEGKLTKDWRADNPDIEPASELLKRIQAEKAQLIKDKKIKKQKPLPPISKDEKPFDLPEGWVWCRLGDICSKTGSGSTPSGGKSAYVKIGIKFVRSQNVYNDGFRWNREAYISEQTHKKMIGTELFPEDLLLNITGGSIGRCCILPENFDTANINQHVAIIRSINVKIGYFLHKVICSLFFQNAIIDAQTGAGREGLPKNKMDNMLIPLTPLPEQKAIVAKVEKLLALCEQLQTQITNNQSHAEQLMQAVLKEAFSQDTTQIEAVADNTQKAAANA